MFCAFCECPILVDSLYTKTYIDFSFVTVRAFLKYGQFDEFFFSIMSGLDISRLWSYILHFLAQWKLTLSTYNIITLHEITFQSFNASFGIVQAYTYIYRVSTYYRKRCFYQQFHKMTFKRRHVSDFSHVESVVLCFCCVSRVKNLGKPVLKFLSIL